MILLITSSTRAQECAVAIERATNQRTQICPGLSLAARILRSTECSALVIDQNLMEADPAAAAVMLSEAETAIPVFVNFAICGMERVVRYVRSALQRREEERIHAVREAEANLRSQLTGALTGILLSSQLAMEVPAVPAAAQARLRSVYQLAMSMRERLEGFIPHASEDVDSGGSNSGQHGWCMGIRSETTKLTATEERYWRRQWRTGGVVRQKQ